MADNIILNSNTTVGDTVATDDVGGVHYQRTKVHWGVDGTGTQVTSDTPLPVSNSSAGSQRTTLHRYLDTVGDGSGTKNANGNYSGAEEIFFIEPPAATIYRITRLIVTIEDGNGMTWDGYGNLAALTNGIEVQTKGDSGVIVDLTDNVPVKYNVMWGANCYDAELKSTGAGNDFFQVRWTFAKAGQVLRLDGDTNDRLEVVFNDSFVGLVSHYFKVDGYIE